MPRLRRARVEHKVCPNVVCGIVNAAPVPLKCGCNVVLNHMILESWLEGREFVKCTCGQEIATDDALSQLCSQLKCPEGRPITWERVRSLRNSYEPFECSCSKGTHAMEDIAATHYEGMACPYCHQGYEPETVKTTHEERLIVMGRIPPVYRDVERAQCTVCGTLIKVNQDWVDSLWKCDCGETLWSLAEKKKISASVRTAQANMANPDGHVDALMTQARVLERARLSKGQCPHCSKILKPTCPLCASLPGGVTKACISQNPTTVWQRVFGESIVVVDDGIAAPVPDSDWTAATCSECNTAIVLTDDAVNHITRKISRAQTAAAADKAEELSNEELVRIATRVTIDAFAKRNCPVCGGRPYPLSEDDLDQLIRLRR